MQLAALPAHFLTGVARLESVLLGVRPHTAATARSGRALGRQRRCDNLFLHLTLHRIYLLDWFLIVQLGTTLDTLRKPASHSTSATFLVAFLGLLVRSSCSVLSRGLPRFGPGALGRCQCSAGSLHCWLGCWVVTIFSQTLRVRHSAGVALDGFHGRHRLCKLHGLIFILRSFHLVRIEERHASSTVPEGPNRSQCQQRRESGRVNDRYLRMNVPKSKHLVGDFVMQDDRLRSVISPCRFSFDSKAFVFRNHLALSFPAV